MSSALVVHNKNISTILVKNLETRVRFPFLNVNLGITVISVLQYISVAQHCGNRGAHLRKSKGVKSECKKVSRKFNSVCFIDLWRVWQLLTMHGFQAKSLGLLDPPTKGRGRGVVRGRGRGTPGRSRPLPRTTRVWTRDSASLDH